MITQPSEWRMYKIVTKTKPNQTGQLIKKENNTKESWKVKCTTEFFGLLSSVEL